MCGGGGLRVKPKGKPPFWGAGPLTEDPPVCFLGLRFRTFLLPGARERPDLVPKLCGPGNPEWLRFF